MSKLCYCTIHIHVVDLAKGHVKALKCIEESCGMEIFNLGTGMGYSVLDIVKAFEKVNGVKIPYVITDRQAGDIGVCYSTRARRTGYLAGEPSTG